MSFDPISFAIAVGAALYQRREQKKQQEKAKKAAEDRFGYELATEGEMTNVLVPYGRCKIGGARVFHFVSELYFYQDPPAGATVFTTTGDVRGGDVYNNNVAISGDSVAVSLYEDSNGNLLADPSIYQRWLYDYEHWYNAIPLAPGSRLIRTAQDSGWYFYVPTSGPSDGLTIDGKFVLYSTIFQEDARVTINHTPYTIIDEDSFQTDDTIGFSRLKVQSYNSTTGEVQLYRVIQWTSDIDEYEPGKASLRENKLNKEYRAFLYVQQVICYKGIQAVHGISIDDRDWRHKVFGGSGRIYAYTDGNQACPMITENSKWIKLKDYSKGKDWENDRSTALFSETAYSSHAFKLDRDDPEYNGVPEVSHYLEGLKVKTVNSSYILSSTKSYSNNPAFCLLDYLLDSTYGKGLDPSQIDLRSFYKASLVCDDVVMSAVIPNGVIWKELVRIGEIRELKKYECNLPLESSDDVRTNINKILEVMGDAMLVWSDGKYKLRLSEPKVWDAGTTYNTGDLVQYQQTLSSPVDLYRARGPSTNVQPPTSLGVLWDNGATLNETDDDLCVAYLTDDDLINEQEISQIWPTNNERLNHCTIRFLDEDLDFEENTVNWPPKYDVSNNVYDTYLAQDNGVLLETEEFIHGISTRWHAMAFAEQRVRSSRHNLVYDLYLHPKYLKLEPGDYLNISSTLLGISGELLRVIEVEITDQGNVNAKCFKFDARTLAWNAPDDEVIIARNTYEYQVAQVPGSCGNDISFNPDELDGQELSSGWLRWNPSPDTSVTSYRIYYNEGPAEHQHIDTTWKSLGETTALELYINYLQPGIYSVAIVAVSKTGRTAPQFDEVTGSRWPVCTINTTNTIDASGGATSYATINCYRVINPINTDPLPDAPSGGSYNFETGTLTPPTSWYSTPADARTNQPVEKGNMYYCISNAAVTSPDTVAGPLSWTAPDLYNPSVNVAQVFAYYRGESAPTGAPNGGIYEFPSAGLVTVPTGGGVTWSATKPSGSGDLYETQTTVEILGDYGRVIITNGWSSPQMIDILNPDANQSVTLELYTWAGGVEPTIPLTPGLYTTQYTWATLDHGSMSGELNSLGWRFEVPTNTGGVNSQVLWIVRKNVTDIASNPSTPVDWGLSDVKYIRSDGDNILYTKTVTLELYTWSYGIPNGPAGGVAWDWATESYILAPDGYNIPSGWQTDTTGGATGQTLYRASKKLIDTGAAVTSNVVAFWDVGKLVEGIGYFGKDGDDGQPGDNGEPGASGRKALRAYAKAPEPAWRHNQ